MVEKQASSTVTEKGSKFMAYLMPYDSFKQARIELIESNPKASHVVYATRHINKYDQIVESSSDDGEPKGAAGLPALNVLRGEELINVGLIIVRYFGGTKLGVGGMVRAYSEASKSVIAVSDIIKYEKLFKFTFYTIYSNIKRVEYLLKKMSIVINNKEFDENSCKWEIEANQHKIDEFKMDAGRSISWSA